MSAPFFKRDTYYREISDIDLDKKIDHRYQTFKRLVYNDFDNSTFNLDIDVDAEGWSDNDVYLLSHCSDLNLYSSFAWYIDDNITDLATNTYDEIFKIAKTVLFIKAKIGNFAMTQHSSVYNNCRVKYRCAQDQAKKKRSGHYSNCPCKVNLSLS